MLKIIPSGLAHFGFCFASNFKLQTVLYHRQQFMNSQGFPFLLISLLRKKKNFFKFRESKNSRKPKLRCPTTITEVFTKKFVVDKRVTFEKATFFVCVGWTNSKNISVFFFLHIIAMASQNQELKIWEYLRISTT